MTEPRLSICVATRNRGIFLAEMLAALTPQLSAETELVIVDGASTDDTQSIIARYIDAGTAVRYVRLDKNGGSDRDYDLAVQMATGTYCWLMTDDDVPTPDAVARILDGLSTEPSLLLVNAEDWSFALHHRLKERRVDIATDRHYSPGQDERLLEELGYLLSFIGATVIERELWLARNRTRYFGSAFVHFGVIFQADLPRGAVFLARPVLRGRIGNISYSARRFEIWATRWPRLVWSFERFSRAARRSVALERPWASLKTLFVARGNGQYNLTQFGRLIAPRQLTLFKRLAALSIALFPEPLAWLTMYLLWSIDRNADPTTRYDWLFAPSYDRFFRSVIHRPQ